MAKRRSKAKKTKTIYKTRTVYRNRRSYPPNPMGYVMPVVGGMMAIGVAGAMMNAFSK